MLPPEPRLDGYSRVLPVKSNRTSKIDPSFKSKRYRDKLRTEIKALEGLLPVDKTSLHRKLDSQAVFRLVIAHFWIKKFFTASLNRRKSGSHDAGEPTGEESGKETKAPVNDVINEGSLLQLLDGFLLMFTADGTILYISDNVLHYLGFNQVDLIYRCLYSIISPDDYDDVKAVLEQQTRVNPKFMDIASERDTKPKSEAYRPLSFFCQMKCYHSNSAGFTKICCSGWTLKVPNLGKSTRMSTEIVLALCQPADIIQDMIGQNTVDSASFWTKHSLGLHFKEIDKGAAAFLGYSTKEIEGKTFYSFIHPEDLKACVTCHRALIDKSEHSQLMYIRILDKHREWKWIRSEGKTLQKDSKKTSIVFTHRPVRENSTFATTECLLRRKYALKELVELSGCQSYPEQFSVKQASPTNFPKQTVHCSYAETRSGTPTLGTLFSPCPSSWHSMQERHSPVLPSTHLAHKVIHHEKQAQFQEFRWRQHLERQKHSLSSFLSWPSVMGQHKNRYLSIFYPQLQWRNSPAFNGGYFPPEISAFHNPTMLKNWESSNNREQILKFNPLHSNNASSVHSVPMDYRLYEAAGKRKNCFQPSLYRCFGGKKTPMYAMPPSPPPSPHLHSVDQYRHSIKQSVPDVPNWTHSDYFVCNQLPSSWTSHCMFSIKELQRTTEKYLQDGYYTSVPASLTNQQRRSPQPTWQTLSVPATVTWDVHPAPVSSRSCAITEMKNNCNPRVIKWDVEASVHMRIVENPSSFPEDKSDVELPPIGSFLEYLNDV